MNHPERPTGDSARTDLPSPRLPNGPVAEIGTCWAEIGTHGDGNCPELQKFIRCANCPVYASAAVRLLDHPSPPGYRREWKEHFAQQQQPTTPRKHSAVIFRIGAEWLALPTEAFQEVADHRPVHSLPHRHHGIVVGLVNIRGELLICVSLGHLLRLGSLLPCGELRTIRQRLLVGDWNGNRFVFPVDEVCGIHRFDPQQLQEPPAMLAKSDLTFTRGILNWEGRTVGFLDPNLLFSSLNRSLA